MRNDGLFYICAMTPEDCRGGILGYKLDGNAVCAEQFHMPFCGCNYLAYSTNGQVLYSTCIIDGAGGAAAFKIKADGSLEYMNKLPSEGKSTCYIIAAPGGRYLYTANYFSANISEFSLNEDGSLKALERTIKFAGRGPHERQEMAHPHFVNFTPDGQNLIVIDLGLDAVKQFAFDPDKGLIDPDNPRCFTVTPPGSGPRHLIFNKQHNMAYLLNEVGNTVSVLRFEQQDFSLVQQLSTLPEGFAEFSKAAAIRLSPDGRFLLASNRGLDSIAVYRVQEDNLLELQSIVPSGGVSPRDINFLPDGIHVAAANEFSDNVVFFDFDPVSGTLTPNLQELKLPRPLAVYW